MRAFISSGGFLLLCLGVLVGCGGLRLGEFLKISTAPYVLRPTEAPPGLQRVQEVSPPLTQEWEGDVSAGVGSGAPTILDSVVLIGTLRGELYALHLRTGKKLGSVSLGNAITGSPVIKGHVAYIALAGTKESLVAYDLVLGKVIWKQTAGDIQGTPLLVKGKLYCGNTLGTFLCIKSETGEIEWQLPLPRNTTLKGIRGSAAADSTRVFFGADDGCVYALNMADGSESWHYETGQAIHASVTCDNKRIFASTLHGRAIALDAETGRLLWSYEIASPVYAPIRVDTARAIVCSVGGAVAGLDVSSGKVLWKYLAGGPINAGPVITGRYLLVGTLSKEFFALDMGSGTIIWTTSVKGRIKTAPALAEGKIIIATDEPLIVAFRGSAQ